MADGKAWLTAIGEWIKHGSSERLVSGLSDRALTNADGPPSRYAGASRRDARAITAGRRSQRREMTRPGAPREAIPVEQRAIAPGMNDD